MTGDGRPALLPALAAPTGGGAIRGLGETFATSGITGTASLTIPIAMSAGRPGGTPTLELRYDSSSGSGPFGIGWKLSPPAFTRRTDRGLPTYDDTVDTFVMGSAEQLVPTEAGFVRDGFRIQRYRPRIESAFTRIERWTEVATGATHWRTTSRDNLLGIFGRDDGARISEPGRPDHVFSWLLEETRDDRGNVTCYDYKAEDGAHVDAGLASEASRFADGRIGATSQRYLKRVRYGNRVPVAPSAPAPLSDEAWMFELVLDYGEHAFATPTPTEDFAWPVRPDVVSTYRAGFEVRTYRRCARALMFHRFPELGSGPVLVASTDFGYDVARIRTPDGTFETGPVTSYLATAVRAGYIRRADGSYERATLPALALDYVRPILHDLARPLSPDAGPGVPGSSRAARSEWVDLDGEGLPGVLTTDAQAWYYRANLGDGVLGPAVVERSLPVPSSLGPDAKLIDLGGDGNLDLVRFAPPVVGYFARTPDRGWEPPAPLAAVPNLDWSDPQLRVLDVDGDGLPDLVIATDDALVWHRSLARDGFASGGRVALERDDTLGPTRLYAAGNEVIQLADMSGDGLVDLVRVRAGEVCYWPNLGYGRFGRKITLDHSTAFEPTDLFDARRVRFADIDGSGVNDVVYLGADAVRIYFNCSGNALSAGFAVRSLPAVDADAELEIADVLGRGTACLVWSTKRTDPAGARFVDLMAGAKPHLLSSIANNFGAETRITYASSTDYYLADRAAGRPWLTRLAFPVHVVARVDHADHVASTRLATTFAYHHGYFDGVEREFRGFARVDQWDAERLGPITTDRELVVPPVHTITWYHTGAWLERARLETALAAEYDAGDPLAPRVPDTVLPPGLTVGEERDATRALAGRILRQEIYANDGATAQLYPYSVREHGYAVRAIQRAAAAQPAVFHAHPQDTVSLQYERRPLDPRQQHHVVLEVDAVGNVLCSVTLGYPRRAPQTPEQAALQITVEESTFVNRADELAWHRLGVPIATTTSELTGVAPPSVGLMHAAALRTAIATATEIPFEATAAPGQLQRRVMSRSRIGYLRDDLSGPLPDGAIESRALVHESYRQAFTPGLILAVYGDRLPGPSALADGGYVELDGAWWAPSGTTLVDPDRFYVPTESIDPFGHHHHIRYDAHTLLPIETENPLGERVVVENDYRVLAPAVVLDENANRSAVAFDALGMVVATARIGKPGELGDTLTDPTTAVAYDLHRWVTSGGTQPVHVHAQARERHGAPDTRWQESFTYYDGSGRIALKKVRAAAGRWIGSGRIVFDNKGYPVKQYEPYFATTPDYEADDAIVATGVTAILRRDPLGRVIRTEFPDGSSSHVVFDAWREETWDANDDVVGSAWLARAQTGDAAAQRSAALAIAHAATPAIRELDTLGRSFLAIADNAAGGRRETRLALDLAGRTRAVTDPRGVVTLVQQFDMLGRVIHERSADAGEAHALVDLDARPVLAWTANGQVVRRAYDSLRRSTHVFVRTGTGPEVLVERVVYGELAIDATARNLHGVAHQVYDGAGVVVRDRIDLDGNEVERTRRLTIDPRTAPDWIELGGVTDVAAIEAAAAPLLDAETFTITATFDALGRVTSRKTPDGSVTAASYDDGDNLAHVESRLRGAAAATVFVDAAEYNARGQIVRLAHGNATTCTYEYDPATFRLARRRAVRTDGQVLQDQTYTYDPVGNIVEIADAVGFGNPTVSADARYEYDALYQLVAAEGREHPGQQPSDLDPAFLRFGHPSDLQALRRYRQTYGYDPAGNVLEIAHQPLGAGPSGWVRTYAYAADSNRLGATSLPGDLSESRSATYQHDARGNMIAMPHLAALAWDHADRLQRVELGGGGTVHFSSDLAGQRVRKAYDHGGFIEERIYFDGYEVYRKRRRSDYEVVLERQTLALHDVRGVIAYVETRSVDTGTPAFVPTTRARFQLGDHLGTTALELDEAGAVFSYEEHYPFGATAWCADTGSTEVSARRYRYLGKERDEETGLCALGSRYYAAWLARWISTDPAGYVDGANLYRYSSNRPTVLADPSGTDGAPGPGMAAVNDFLAKLGVRAAPEIACEAAPVIAADAAPSLVASGLPMATPAAGVGTGVAAPAIGIAGTGAVILGMGAYTFTTSNNIVQFGNPWGVAHPGLGILNSRPWMASRPAMPKTLPDLEPAPNQNDSPKPDPKKKPQDKNKEDEDKKRKKKPGRIYVTYQKWNNVTRRYYSGRTSMVIDLNLPLRPQAIVAMNAREANHHMNLDENDEPTGDFDPAELDKFDIGTAVNYENRYKDIGYLSIRGREQQLIDYRGGAQSDTKPGPHQTENTIRGVSKTHEWGRVFDHYATQRFARINKYTGN